MIKPFPKPQIFQPKTSRLFWRKAVTVVGGFRCSKGVVLLADTQETVGVSKRHVPKLRFEQDDYSYLSLVRREDDAPPRSDLAVAFCGATDNGAFVDKLVDLAWKAASGQPDIESVCAAIEESIGHTYQHFGAIYQLGYMPSAELIYGVKMNGRSRLFNALGPAVNEKREYCTGGVGTYVADFLAARMYTDGLTVQQCVILAAYILFQTKEHVDGCGGKSHIAILREDGPSGLVDSQRVDAITENLQRADTELGSLLLASSNLDLSDKDFSEQAAEVYKFLEIYREEQKKDFRKWEEFRRNFDTLYGLSIKRDSLGLTQSIDQTSEDQQ
jgi:20S proteasome alpha/beta subunit